MNNARKIIVGAAFAISASLVFACMFIEKDWILAPNELLRTPETLFRKEMALWRIEHPEGFVAKPATNGYSSQTIAADIADLASALRDTNLDADEQARILSRYESARRQLHEVRIQLQEPDEPVQHVVLPSVPDGIPEEFALYFVASSQFHLGNTNQAQTIWLKLLDLPAERRTYRSTWATFMLGKTYLQSDTKLAIELFREVRDLAKNGFTDGLGLASASLGWEARAFLNLNDPESAIQLYLEQQNTGDADTQSIWFAARAVVNLPPEKMIDAARNPIVSSIVSSYLLSHSEWQMEWNRNRRGRGWEAWLSAVLAAGKHDPSSAEQFAWVAYQWGDYESAARWLGLADYGSPRTLWLAAKLKLREGDLDTAADLLAQATRRVPLDDSDGTRPIDTVILDSKLGPERMRGELAAIQFQRRDYVDALNILCLAEYWRDAAYVADRILTVDELREYVDQFWPAKPVEDAAIVWEEFVYRPLPTRVRIRYLLARRLARDSRYEEARAYYPLRWLPTFDALVDHLAKGRSKSISKESRGRHLASAAQLTRSYGFEIYGTATAPDWMVFRGNFSQFGPTLKMRQRADENSIFAPTEEELRRHNQSQPTPNERFHYRRVASELAWEAASLLPDQSEETAVLLNRAGQWLAYKDAQYADKFYKALVIRCGYTELGTAADRKRWFPRMTSDGKLAEAMPPPVHTTYSGPWPGDPN